MGHRAKVKHEEMKLAKGGKAGKPVDTEYGHDEGIQKYNAQGSNEEHEALDEEPSFAEGGEVDGMKKMPKKRKMGGIMVVAGERPKTRMDKRARGGHVERKEHEKRMEHRAAGGVAHSPYSNAVRSSNAFADSAPGRGHENVRPGSTEGD